MSFRFFSELVLYRFITIHTKATRCCFEQDSTCLCNILKSTFTQFVFTFSMVTQSQLSFHHCYSVHLLWRFDYFLCHHIDYTISCTLADEPSSSFSQLWVGPCPVQILQCSHLLSLMFVILSSKLFQCNFRNRHLIQRSCMWCSVVCVFFILRCHTMLFLGVKFRVAKKIS